MSRLTFFFFLAGVVVLSFFAGAVCTHYKIPYITDFLHESFNEAEDFKKEKIDPHRFPAYLTDVAIIDSEARTAMQQHKVAWDKTKAYAGYTLITLRYSCTVYLVDMQGNIVHSWHIPFHTVWPHPTHIENLVSENKIYISKAYLYPNGDVLALFQGVSSPYGYGIAKVDKDAKLLWQYSDNTHHDFYVDGPSGDIYTLIQKDRKDAFKAIFPALPHKVEEDSIIRLSSEGKELERVSIIEAFMHSPYATALLKRSSPVWDITHTNSVMMLDKQMAKYFPQFKPGQVLISMRNLDALAVIDMQLKKVVWFEKGLWTEQHAASFQPDGTILLLDNHAITIHNTPFSRLLKINPVTAAPVWEYTGSPKQPFYAFCCGRAQSLPNGDILVTETLASRIFEVTAQGEVVWNFILPSMTAPLFPNLPPYTKAFVYGDNNRNPWKDNTITIITSGRRYAASEIPFLKAVVEQQ